MKSSKWFWGIFFLAAAAFVVATQIVPAQAGLFAQIGFWSIAASVLLAAVLIHSLIDLNFFGVFVPAALLYSIYQKPLNLQYLDIWLLLFTAVLASIGFSIIFHKHHHHCHEHWHDGHWDEHFTDTSENLDGNTPCAKVSFGSSSKYLHGDSVTKGEFVSSFGTLEVYFDQAMLAPEGAEVYVEANFGTIKLFIPRVWRVVNHVHSSFGDVKNMSRNNQPLENAPVLKLSGNAHFGSVELYYI